MSNSEKIYTSLIELVNAEVSNLILGSESMAGATQSYVGSTKAHQDIFRDRIKVYREYIENAMNEEIIPRLVAMGYIENGLEFKYSGGLEMSVECKIDLYDFLSGNTLRRSMRFTSFNFPVIGSIVGLISINV